ncbi:MAG: hypothetical protein AAF708_20615 [Deinococcota bacterium]
MTTSNDVPVMMCQRKRCPLTKGNAFLFLEVIRNTLWQLPTWG